VPSSQGWRCPNGHFLTARKLAIGHRIWHGGGTALGVAVTILAKSPKTTLSRKIGRCTAAPMAVPTFTCTRLQRKMAVALDIQWRCTIMPEAVYTGMSGDWLAVAEDSNFRVVTAPTGVHRYCMAVHRHRESGATISFSTES